MILRVTVITDTTFELRLKLYNKKTPANKCVFFVVESPYFSQCEFVVAPLTTQACKEYIT